MKLSLAQLSDQSGLPPRSVRFYIQKGLVDRPEGERRGAWYTERHLEQCLRVRQWREAGLSLEAIAGLMTAASAPPRPQRQPGAVEVRSHLLVAEGVELSISPDRAGLDSEQVRQLFRAVRAALAQIQGPESDPEGGEDHV